MEITLLTHDDRWKGLRPTVHRAAMAALTYQKQDGVAVTIVLSNDAEVQVLNRDYRGKNKPTNVLSFPDDTLEDGVQIIGDIILAYETIAAEALAQQKKIKHHVSHLTIHGVLHLLGFDHEQEQEAEVMESHEIAILARIKVANPYECP